MSREAWFDAMQVALLSPIAISSLFVTRTARVLIRDRETVAAQRRVISSLLVADVISVGDKVVVILPGDECEQREVKHWYGFGTVDEVVDERVAVVRWEDESTDLVALARLTVVMPALGPSEAGCASESRDNDPC